MWPWRNLFRRYLEKNPLLKKMETHPYRQSPVPRYTETYLKYLPTELRSELRLLKESCTFRIHVDFEKDSNIMTIEDSLFRMKFSIDSKDARDLISSISRNTSSRLISLGSVDFLELNLPSVFYDSRTRQFKFLNRESKFV